MKLSVIGAILTLPLVTASNTVPLPQSVTAHASRTACTDTYNSQVNGTQSPSWSQVQWAENSCGYFIRGVSKCEDPGKPAHKIIREGGWVHSTGLWTRATCPGTQPFISEAGYDLKLTVNGSSTRTWYWRG